LLAGENQLEEEIAVTPEFVAAFDVGCFFDMTFPAFPAARARAAAT
jgi:EREBP-like factor